MYIYIYIYRYVYIYMPSTSSNQQLPALRALDEALTALAKAEAGFVDKSLEDQGIDLDFIGL